VDNALRHTPAGGRVDLSLDELEGGFAIRVTDTGPGIPAQERLRVFDRFYRGTGSDTPGSGLGLAIVRRIAERHGAVVTLTDNPQGSGLKVEISFPQSARPQDRPTDSLRDG
jgi:two-component system OmpR family sensor kinase